MKVSIIIPVYNTGEYLRTCIDSILGQTYGDIEVVIVDDGSDTATAALCDDLAAGEPRILLRHVPNGGVSRARNIGLDIASGDVVCFVDSDDSISPDMVTSLVQALEVNDAQIAMCDAVTLRPAHADELDTIEELAESRVLEREDITPAMLTRLAGSAWRCAYRRTDMSDSCKIRFKEGLKLSEDRIFNIEWMAHAKRLTYIKKPLYYRLIRKGSTCYSYHSDYTRQIEIMRDTLIPIVQTMWGEGFVPAYERQIADHIRSAVENFTSRVGQDGLSSVYGRIQELVSNPSVRECLRTADDKDLRSRLILAGKTSLLLSIGIAANIYRRIRSRS